MCAVAAVTGGDGLDRGHWAEQAPSHLSRHQLGGGIATDDARGPRGADALAGRAALGPARPGGGVGGDPHPGVDPTQQKMMLVMPLVLGYMFYFAMSGLVIYWLTSNVVGIAQQWFFNKTAVPLVAAPAPKSSQKMIPKDGRKRA